jgi:YD repeat-containing protein
MRLATPYFSRFHQRVEYGPAYWRDGTVGSLKGTQRSWRRLTMPQPGASSRAGMYGSLRQTTGLASQQGRAFAAVVSLILLVTLQPLQARGAVTYGYDPLGRIATALYDNGACEAYIYDANGNLVSQINFMPAPTSPPVWNSVSWGGFTWGSAAQQSVWGGGSVWGCSSWSAQ